MARPTGLLYAPQSMSAPHFFRLLGPFLLSPLCLLGLGAGNAAQEGAQKDPMDLRKAEQGGRVLKLTLEDSVRIALHQNLDLEAEKLATEVARHNARGSWGSFDALASLTLRASDAKTQGQSQIAGGTVIESDSKGLDGSLRLPFVSGGSVSISLNHTTSGTNSNIANLPDSTVDVLTVSLTQPLLRGAWKRYATTAQREQELALLRQNARQNQVRADLIQSVYNAYWDLVSAIEDTSVRKLAVERGEKQLEQDRKRLDLGAGTEVDVLQAETNVAQQEEALLRAGFSQREAEDNLRQLVFQNRRQLDTEDGIQADPEQAEPDTFLDQWDWPIEPLTQLPKVEAREYDWRVSFDRALEQRPELVQSRLEIDTAEVRYDSAYSGYLPQLDFNLSSSSTGFNEKAENSLKTAGSFGFPDNRISLDFSMPIGNRSARYALRAARVAIRQARLNYSRQELTVMSGVRAAVRDLIFRAEAVRAASKSAALATRQEQAEQLRMEIGLSTTFQVLEFQQTLAEANSALVLAQAAYAKALVGLQHAEGKLEIDGNDGR